MKDLIIEIFGEYVPVTYEVTDGDVVSEIVANGAAGVDWAYVGSILIFCVALYGIISLLRVVIKL